jgi:hypothetical protein
MELMPGIERGSSEYQKIRISGCKYEDWKPGEIRERRAFFRITGQSFL